MSRKREAMNYFSIESAVALLVSLFINVSQADAALEPPILHERLLHGHVI